MRFDGRKLPKFNALAGKFFERLGSKRTLLKYTFMLKISCADCLGLSVVISVQFTGEISVTA